MSCACEGLACEGGCLEMEGAARLLSQISKVKSSPVFVLGICECSVTLATRDLHSLSLAGAFVRDAYWLTFTSGPRLSCDLNLHEKWTRWMQELKSWTL